MIHALFAQSVKNGKILQNFLNLARDTQFMGPQGGWSPERLTLKKCSAALPGKDIDECAQKFWFKFMHGLF